MSIFKYSFDIRFKISPKVFHLIINNIYILIYNFGKTGLRRNDITYINNENQYYLKGNINRICIL